MLSLPTYPLISSASHHWNIKWKCGDLICLGIFVIGGEGKENLWKYMCTRRVNKGSMKMKPWSKSTLIYTIFWPRTEQKASHLVLGKLSITPSLTEGSAIRQSQGKAGTCWAQTTSMKLHHKHQQANIGHESLDNQGLPANSCQLRFKRQLK